MPLIKVSIRKRTSFQGKTEDFSNVYTFDVPSTDSAPMETLINQVRELEQGIHGSQVEFIQGYAFVDKSIAGWLNPRLMYGEVSWSGQRGAAGNGALYLECADLLKWPLPRKLTDFGSVSRKRQLMKYLHLCTDFDNVPNQTSGQQPLTNNSLQVLRNFGQAIQAIPSATLCSTDGARPTGGPVAHPYVEHRQFPRGRKE